MGCFNDTCLISSMPIRYHDPVVVVILASSVHDSVISCNTSAYHTVEPILFEGTYDDYGSVENIGGAVDLLINNLRPKIIEKPETDKYGESEISKEKFDLEMLLTQSHDNRIEFKNLMGNISKLNYAFIHKDIYNAIFENYQMQYSTYYKQRLIDYKCKFSDVLNDIPAYVNELQKRIKSNEQWMNDISNKITPNFRYLTEYVIEDSPFTNNFVNKLFSYYKRHHNYPAIRIDDILLSEDVSIESVTEIAKVIWLMEYMDATNHMWIKPMTSGQEYDTAALDILPTAMKKLVRKMKRRDAI